MDVASMLGKLAAGPATVDTSLWKDTPVITERPAGLDKAITLGKSQANSDRTLRAGNAVSKRYGGSFGTPAQQVLDKRMPIVGAENNYAAQAAGAEATRAGFGQAMSIPTQPWKERVPPMPSGVENGTYGRYGEYPHDSAWRLNQNLAAPRPAPANQGIMSRLNMALFGESK